MITVSSESGGGDCKQIAVVWKQSNACYYYEGSKKTTSVFTTKCKLY